MENEEPTSQTQTAAADAPAPQAAPTTPTTVTIVKADGTQFVVDLNGMTVAQSVELRTALSQVNAPTDYGALADQMAALALKMQSIVSVNLPDGMSYQQAINNLMTALKEGGGTLKDSADPYLKELMASEIGQTIAQGDAWKTVEGTAAVTSATGDFFTGLGRPYSAVYQGIQAVGATGAELGRAVTPTISPDQARAFGAAYAAALYMQVDAPSGPGKRRDANFMDKGIAWVQTTTDDVWRWLPPEWAGIFTAIGKWAGSGFKKDWDSCYQEAIAEHTAYRATPQQDYETRLSHNLEASLSASARPQAAAMLTQTDNVAGADIKPLAEISQQGGVIREPGLEGLHSEVTFENGQPKIESLQTPDGQPLTMAEREADRWKDIAEAATPKTTADWAGAAVGTYVGAKYIAPPVLRASAGTVRAGAGAMAGVASAYNDSVAATVGGTSSFNAARTAAELQRLENKLADVQGKLEVAKAEAAVHNRPDTVAKAIRDTKAEIRTLERAGDKADDLATARRTLTALEGEAADMKKAADSLTAEQARAANTAKGAANKAVNDLLGEQTKIEKALKGSNGVLGLGRQTGAIDAAANAAEEATAKGGVSPTRVAVAQRVSAHGEQASSFFSRTLQRIGVGNGAAFAEQAPKAFAFAKGVAEKIPFIAPLIAGTQTVANVAENDTAGAVLRGAETAGLWWGVKTLGSRFLAPAGAIMEGANFTHSAMRHDNRGMVTSGTALGTMAAGAGIGAAIGLFGGPAAPVTVPVGAGIGFVWGGVASIFTGLGAGHLYDKSHPRAAAQAATRDGAAGAADPGLAAAGIDATERARDQANGATGGFRWPWEPASAAAPIQSQTAGIAMQPAGLPRGATSVLNIG